MTDHPDTEDTKDLTRPGRDEVVWGKTPAGEGQPISTKCEELQILTWTIFRAVFRVPTTHDVLTLFHPSHPKSHFDLLNLALLGLQLLLFFWSPRGTARTFFFFYFAFWRAAYDAGLGWILTKQSKKKWIVKEVQRLGWLEQPAVRAWIRAQLAEKMGKDYSFDVRVHGFFIHPPSPKLSRPNLVIGTSLGV
jgi:phosphatidylethanolamine N-methyltransferase